MPLLSLDLHNTPTSETLNPVGVPPAIRRSLATGLLRAGASVEAIRHLLGHTSLAATDHYLALDKADLRRAVELLEG